MNYDTIILGFGKAGKTLAATLAKQGKAVALIEKSSGMYGGTCINVGCIPSKSLITSAAEAALHPDDSFEQKASRYAAAIVEKQRVTSMMRAKNYKKLDDLSEVTIYDGLGRFQSPTEVEVLLTDGRTELLTAKNIYINTGSELIPLPIPDIDNNPKVYTSETLMEESRLPQRLVLIGAGYIGMEFASLYANFGSQVTVLQNGDSFLPREDRDVADEIRAIQERRGVRFLLGAQTLRIEDGTVVYTLHGEEQTLEADAILIATGRKPNTAALQVERAGVELTPRGAVLTDDLLRTTAPNIWALGDVNGGPQFTFVSLDDYRIVLSQLTGGSYNRASRANVPYSVFMDTPLGRVGLTEKEATEQNIPIRVLKLPTAAVPKAQVLRKTDGFLKAIVHAETGKILGAALLCPESYELINTIKLAMDLDADAAHLRDMIYTHPTMTEAFNELFAL
ncbi:MAG: FAD-dependent oxidoreductase [Lachnospiraceae bacterium]|nr:FAD-dependent oxidoreductase [Lachnospiraceae bacterium]